MLYYQKEQRSDIPLTADCLSRRTSSRYLGVSGRQGRTTKDSNAGNACSSIRYGHRSLVPADTVMTCPRSVIITALNKILDADVGDNKTLSCCCNSRSYCVRRKRYTGKLSNRFWLHVYEWLVCTIRFNGYRVYEGTQILHTQA